MRLDKICVIFIFIFMFSLSAQAKDVIVLSGHPNYPPSMWRKGDKIIGVGARLATEVLTRLGYDVQIKYVGPWKRVQEYARDGKIDGIIACYINDERIAYMDYTDPYMVNPDSVIVSKGSEFVYEKWDDLIGRKGVMLYGESYGEKFDKFIKNKLDVSQAYDVKAAFLNLSSGRSDYFLWGYYPCKIAAAKHGYSHKISILPVNIAEESFYMTFSKKSKYKHLIPQINRIIKELKKNGVIDAWIEQVLKKHASKRVNIEE